MPVLLHALAALVLGDFGFASFFKRTHTNELLTYNTISTAIQAWTADRINLLLQ
jgi:hypothetical protein